MATTHTYPQPQPGYSHVLHTPFGLWVLRGLELILAIILLGLSAYLVSQHSTSGSDLTLFTVSSHNLYYSKAHHIRQFPRL